MYSICCFQKISNFAYNLSSVLFNEAERGEMAGFFDGWEGAPDWLNSNTSLDRRLEIVYADNPTNLIESFLTAAEDNGAFNEVVTDMPELTALDYAREAIQYFPAADLSMNDMVMTVARDTITLAEHHIYGSSRLGIQTYDTLYRNTYHADPNIARITRLSADREWYSRALEDYIEAPAKAPWGHISTDTARETRTVGKRYYELTDHLGNVIATVMDRKTGGGSTGVGTLYSHWKADIASVQDYYPGGMMMPGRWKAMGGDTTIYKFGNQGQFKDDEVYGFGNLYAFKFRMQDTRTNRFWTNDPIAKDFPWNSPYAFSENRLIDGIEFEGLEVVLVNSKKDPTIYKIGMNEKSKNAIHIFAHGNPLVIADETGMLKRHIRKPSEFAKLLDQKSEQWRDRKSNGETVIVLHSCFTGAEEYKSTKVLEPFAQKMSKSKEFKNVTIIAPSEADWFEKGGMFSADKEVGPYKAKGGATNKHGHKVRDDQNPGHWNIYKNGKK